MSEMVRIVVGRKGGGPRCSVLSVHIKMVLMNTETKHDKRTILNSATKHRTENKHPQNTGGKRLPKYDSQSVPTNDTCL
jgi:hypothetical protein